MVTSYIMYITVVNYKVLSFARAVECFFFRCIACRKLCQPLYLIVVIDDCDTVTSYSAFLHILSIVRNLNASDFPLLYIDQLNGS